MSQTKFKYFREREYVANGNGFAVVDCMCNKKWGDDVIFMNFANVIMLFIRIGKTRFRASTQIKQTQVFSA